MPDNRTASIREQIDYQDVAVVQAIRSRIYWVRKMHEGETQIRYEYARETAIANRYADAMEALGIPRVHGYRLAAAVIDAGKAGVRADQQKALPPRA